MSRGRFIVGLLGAFGLATLSYGRAPTIRQKPPEPLESRVIGFCTTEFNVDEDGRPDFIDRAHFDEIQVEFDNSELDLVASFKLGTIVKSGDKADVTVVYSMLGGFRNAIHYGYRPDGTVVPSFKYEIADRFVPNRVPHFEQHQSWARSARDGRWYLESTQLPKVSPAGLKRFLETDLKQVTNTLKNATPQRPLPYIQQARDRDLNKIALLDTLIKEAQ